MSAVRNVLIVGGGIGGLSIAIGLGRIGIRADVVEIKKTWAIYGVGIIQPGNAIRAYKALGVADLCLERGFVYKRQRHYDADGNMIGERTMPAIAGLDVVGHCGIPRPVLHDILVSSARANGAAIRTGVTVAALHDSHDGVEVDFTDGSAGRYDLVIGADGTYSKIREMVFGDVYRPRFSGQGCWRFTTEKPPEMDWSCAFHGPNKAGLIPLTRGFDVHVPDDVRAGQPVDAGRPTARVDAGEIARARRIGRGNPRAHPKSGDTSSTSRWRPSWCRRRGIAAACC